MGINFDNYTKLPFENRLDFAGITNTFFPAGAPISGRELNEVQERLQSQFYNFARALQTMVHGHTMKNSSNFAVISNVEGSLYSIKFIDSFICFDGKVYPITDAIEIGNESIPIENGPVYAELSDEIDIGKNGDTQLYRYGIKSIIIGSRTFYSPSPEDCNEYFKESFIDNDGNDESIVSARKVRNMTIINGVSSGANRIHIGEIVKHDDPVSPIKFKFIPSDTAVYLPSIQNKINDHVHNDIGLVVLPDDFKENPDNANALECKINLGITIAVANPIISLDQHALNMQNYETMQEDFSCIDKAVVKDNVLTLTCFSQKPNNSFPIIIKVV